MQLDFTNLFNSDNEVMIIDYKLDLSDFEYSTYKPLNDGVSIVGKAFCKADVVYLQLYVRFEFNGICDRCAESFSRDFKLDIDKIVVQRLENEDDDNDDYIVVENNVLDLDQLINEEIQLFLPLKMLCDDDCKGLCQKCGKNLNYGECDCERDVDPRMAALLQLLDQ